MFRDRFSPRRLRRYLREVDEAIEQAARSRFYVSHDLRYRTEPDAIVLTGTIVCDGGIRIEVTERLRVLREIDLAAQEEQPPRGSRVLREQRGTPQPRDHLPVQQPARGPQPLHHVHRVDVLGTGEKTLSSLREADVPSIRRLVNEAEEWYWAHLGPRP